MLDAAAFVPMVWALAHKVKRRVPWNTVDVNDLAAAGATGLMTAIKRYRPRAQGRAFPIHKPMTHITVVVEDREA